MRAVWAFLFLASSAGAVVPRPWTPVREEGGRLSCWGRSLDCSRALLPRQITTQQQPLLAAPIQLLAAGPAAFTKSTVLSRTPEKIVLRREGTLDGSPLTVETTLEYDGLTWFTITFPQATAVPALRLEIPLRPQRASFIHYAVCDGAWIRPFPHAGAVADLPADWHYRFLPELWIGDDDLGLSWACESDQAFQLTDRDRAMSLLRRPDATVLQVTLADHAVTLPAGTTFSFGLEATPSRPLPPDWRALRVFHHAGYYGLWRGRSGPNESLLKTIDPDALVKAGIKVVALHAWWANEVCGFQPADPADFRHFLDVMHEHGLRVQVYFAANMASQQMLDNVPGAADWPRGLHPIEWGMWKAGLHGEPQYTGRCVCPKAKGWADYLVNGIAKLLDDYPIDGIYWDHHPLICGAAAHGCGYDRVVDGKPERETTAGLLALRDIVRRVYVLCQQKRRDPIITLHSSWIIVPAVNFADTLMDGENMARMKQSYLMDGGDLTEMPLPLWRAELRAQKWGLAPEYCMYPSPEHLPTDQVLSYAWLHDVGVRAMDNTGLAAILPSWQAFDQINIAGAHFTGYWELAPDVVEPSATLKASLYRDGAKALVVVMNLSAAPQPATLHAARLLPGAADVTVTVPARSFRLILLTAGATARPPDTPPPAH